MKVGYWARVRLFASGEVDAHHGVAEAMFGAGPAHFAQSPGAAYRVVAVVHRMGFLAPTVVATFLSAPVQAADGVPESVNSNVLL